MVLVSTLGRSIFFALNESLPVFFDMLEKNISSKIKLKIKVKTTTKNTNIKALPHDCLHERIC